MFQRLCAFLNKSFHLNLNVKNYFYILQCSSTCGKGMRVRAVTCMNIEGHPAEESMCQEIKPIKEELCDMGSCATGWFFTDWPQQVRNLL